MEGLGSVPRRLSGQTLAPDHSLRGTASIGLDPRLNRRVIERARLAHHRARLLERRHCLDDGLIGDGDARLELIQRLILEDFPPGAAILSVLGCRGLPARLRRGCRGAGGPFLECSGHIDAGSHIGGPGRAAREHQRQGQRSGTRANLGIKSDIHDHSPTTPPASPAAMASPGVAMTRSLTSSPEVTSTVVPKSRPKVTVRSSALPVPSTTATCTPFGRNSSVLTGTDRSGWDAVRSRSTSA